MRKIETIWHHLLFSALEEKRYKWTQQELAEQFSYSLSTINHALRVPSNMGAIRKTAKFFVLEDFQKLLYYWASVRALEKNILYFTYWDASITKIEGFVPPESVYACYTAARKILGEPPADYSKVYFYSPPDKLDIVKERFPKNKSQYPNIFTLKMPTTMPQYGKITTLPQSFVDIWNLRDWYSRDFTQVLEKKIHEILS